MNAYYLAWYCFNTIQLLNDLSWLMFITPIAPFIIQNLAVAALSGESTLFPRWIGFLNLWVEFSLAMSELTVAGWYTSAIHPSKSMG